MRNVLLAVMLASFTGLNSYSDGDVPHTPRLLLNGKLLRRLKRDQERQTARWTAFENRLRNVPDSPERGFELALDFAVTGDEARGTEAKTWAAAHGCARRQIALIRDWVGEFNTPACTAEASLRDQAFASIAAGEDVKPLLEKVRADFIPRLVRGGVPSASDFYAGLELMIVLRAATGEDTRTSAPGFFRNLPVEFLLSLHPDQVAKPDWMTHAAALALVAMDPNLEASQFLQGWALEEQQTLREGPGIAYELLWADPYLPGIAYQNLDPWIYDEEGARLFARSDWSAGACWLSIADGKAKGANCPAGYQERTMQFGSLTVTPMLAKCVDVPHQESRQGVLLWRLPANQLLAYRDKKEVSSHADSSGMWHAGNNVEGKVCRR